MFASDDNGATTSEVLQLKDFILSQTTGGFSDTNPKVYVKRIVGTAVENLIVGETAKFKLKVDPTYTAVAGEWLDETTVKRVGIQALSLFPKSILDPVAAKVGGFVGAAGTIGIADATVAGGTKVYLPAKSMRLEVVANGELTVTSLPNEAGWTPMTSSEMAMIDTEFSGGKVASGASILVKVN